MVDVGYAELARHDGDLAEAERLLRSAQVGEGSPGFGPYQVRASMKVTLARVLVTIGGLDEARTLLVDAFAYARRSRDVPVIADVLTVWASYALATGDAAAAGRDPGLDREPARRGAARPRGAC